MLVFRDKLHLKRETKDKYETHQAAVDYAWDIGYYQTATMVEDSASN